MSNTTREVVEAHEPELIRTSKRVRVHCACGWITAYYATEERAREMFGYHVNAATEETFLTPVIGCKRALCCECGQVRRMNLAGARGDDWMVGDLSKRLEAYWRMLRKLQCANCGTVTRHALIRDFDERANVAEKEDHAA